MLCSVHNIQQRHITVGPYGERAKDIVSQDWDPSPSRTDFNLIHNIHAKIKKLPITITWHHIKGHQDNHVPFEDLDFLAKMNVDMDSRAKEFLWENVDHPVPNHMFSDESLGVFFRGTKLTHFSLSDLYRDIYGPKLLAHWPTARV